MTKDTPQDTSAINIDAALADPSAYFAQPQAQVEQFAALQRRMK